MDNIPLSMLFGLLVLLLFLSAFFSGSETALMSINRYRLKHKARAKHKGAILVSKLLERPDRLIGIILLGNNLVNILASMLTTIIALRIYPGESSLAIAAGILTFVILIFAEVTPKTLAALHPEIIAYPAAFVYSGLLKIFYPFVFTVNTIANGLLKCLGISAKHAAQTALSQDELSTVVKEAGAMIPKQHRNMLLNILELEKTTVEDIMVPRNEIIGIDLDDDLDDIIERLHHVNHTRIPLYRESIDNIIGIIHVKRIIRLIAEGDISKKVLENTAIAPYFIPEGTSLTKQLINFQNQKRRLGVIVDEYGDVLGLATIEDILEEIVGEFTTEPITNIKDIYPQKDGSYLVDGGVHVRDINKILPWSLPTNGPKTINGIILEHMEIIPEPGTSLMLHSLPVEIIKTHNNAVKMVKVFPNKKLSSQKASNQ